MERSIAMPRGRPVLFSRSENSIVLIAASMLDPYSLRSSANSRTSVSDLQANQRHRYSTNGIVVPAT
jgi:hypothetical protein